MLIIWEVAVIYAEPSHNILYPKLPSLSVKMVKRTIRNEKNYNTLSVMMILPMLILRRGVKVNAFHRLLLLIANVWLTIMNKVRTMLLLI